MIKWVFRQFFGISDVPNVLLGELRANAEDNREAYRGWFHVEVSNYQRGGRSKMLVTNDAVACVVKMQFTRGASPSIVRDGIFLAGATEMPKQTFDLIVDRTTQIPVVVIAGKDGLEIGALGIRLSRGSYITGGEFVHPDLRSEQELEPGSYDISLAVRWKGGETSKTYHFTVPTVA
ncbi:MAG: hypothetical protein IID41_17480 [Planctomycetes bacterium]|nr:hypothetical protein [Planctomycetota bacterium]